jgi:hypothetical protein
VKGAVTAVVMLGFELTAGDLRAERAVFRLADLLKSSESRLAAPRDSRRIAFACEADWKALPGSELHLFLEHSPDVEGDRSFLAITLNGGILRSLRLDETNQARTELVVPLPPAMIRRRNELVVSAEQAPSATQAPEKIWTLLGPQSYVALVYETQPLVPALRELPSPLLDPLSDRPPRLAVLLPTQPAPATLEAIGVLVANLVSRVAPTPVALTTVRAAGDARDPLLVVGTASEQPALRALMEEEAHRASRGPASRIAGLLAESHGRRRPVLYVTAASPEGVAGAARDLLAAAGQMDGAVGVIPEIRLREIPMREWQGFAPPRKRFALSDLGYGQDRLMLTADVPLEIPIRVTPDARFLSDGQVALALTLLPEVHEDREARLDVEWNGVVLASLPARRLRPPRLSTSVRIPRDLLRSDNRLALSWKSALPAAGRAPLASVGPATELYLPRDYSAQLPELALLQASFYPFSLRADLSDVIVVIPDGTSEGTVPVVCELSAILGRIAPSGRLAFRVRTASALSPRERSSAHLLLLETAATRPVVEGPAIDWKRLPDGGGLQGLPMVQELVSPWNAEKCVLRVRAASTPILLRTLKRLGEPGGLSRLAGDTAFLGAEGPISYRVTSQQAFEEISHLTRFEAWLQTNWLVLPLLVALVSGGLFLALRLALGHYQATRAAPRPTQRTR